MGVAGVAADPDATYPKEPHPMLQHNATYVWLNLVADPSAPLPLSMRWVEDIVPGKSGGDE